MHACNLMFNLIFSFNLNKCSFIYFSRDKSKIIWILYLSYTWQPSVSKNGETLQPEELCRWARSISITLFWYCFYDFTSSTHADRKTNTFKTVACIGWSIQPSLGATRFILWIKYKKEHTTHGMTKTHADCLTSWRSWPNSRRRHLFWDHMKNRGLLLFTSFLKGNGPLIQRQRIGSRYSEWPHP